ncbi:MAG TPA: DUF6152 family protein [Gammaproteobacteria bacterium]
MRIFGRTAALIIGFAAVSGTALAHHGWSWYTNSDFELTGVIVETHFGNPHDRLTVEADGQQWNVVLSTPDRSRRADFTNGSVKAGDTVTAYGHRHADGDTFEMKTERLRVGDHLYNLYPNRS